MRLMEAYCYFQSSQLINATIESMERIDSKQK